jgi:hypothetical protein
LQPFSVRTWERPGALEGVSQAPDGLLSFASRTVTRASQQGRSPTPWDHRGVRWSRQAVPRAYRSAPRLCRVSTSGATIGRAPPASGGFIANHDRPAETAASIPEVLSRVEAEEAADAVLPTVSLEGCAS